MFKIYAQYLICLRDRDQYRQGGTITNGMKKDLFGRKYEIINL